MRSSAIVLFALVVGTVIAVFPPVLKPHARGPAGAARERIIFTVWGMPFEDRLFKDRYARGFEAVAPGVSVDYQRHADIRMKYNTWHAAGTGPEVMRVMVTDYHQMVESGMLEPLDSYIGGPGGLTDEQLNVFPPALLDALRIDGKLYALPEDSAQFGLYYNKELIDDYDAVHTDDPIGYPDATWDWARLRDAARRLTRRDAAGNVEIYGFDMDIWQWPFMSFFAQAGGRQWSDDGLTTLINSPAGVETLEFFRALVVDDGSWSPYFGLSQGTGPDSRFKNGKTALYMNGSWMVPNFELGAPDLDFAVAPLPHGRAPAILCGSCLWGISAHARHKETGWEMIRWLVEDDQAAAYWDTLRVAPPANLDVVNSDRFKQTSGVPKEGGTGYEVPPMPAARYPDRAAWLRYALNPLPETGKAPGFIPTSLYQRKLEDEIMAMLLAYLRAPDTTPPQQALDAVAASVHQHIDQDRAAKGLPPAIRPGTETPS
ncbi:MAG: sugar ABC transporter substrate-binding protein [Phycisphaerales bacterium]|nr:sugar ABC transporter substrate-binding protein [Phycisphaerales bacterium]